MKFTKFLLEAFSICATEYGTDFKNKEFKKSNLGNTDLYTTFFEHEGVKAKTIWYSDSGEFAFQVAVGERNGRPDWKMHPSKKEITFKNMVQFYCKILFIVKEMVDKLDIKVLSYTASEGRLETLYSRIFSSESFKTITDAYGFELSTETNTEGKKIFIYRR